MKPPSVLLAGCRDDEEYRGRTRDYLRRRFSILVEQFGCVEVPVRNLQEAEVRFANATTLVILRSEYEGPYVALDRANNPFRDGAIPLFSLMKVRKSRHLDRMGESDFPVIDKFEVYASALPTCAADVLRGDFSIEPEVEKYHQRCAREYDEWQEKFEIQPAEREAADAFRRKDFATVVAVLEPHTARLSPVQQGKLDYARRRLAAEP